MACFVLVQRDYFQWPAHPAVWGWFAISIVLTGLLQFFISFTLALLAFWLLEVSTLIFILFAFEYLAGGHLFPLDILPPALSQALYYTPFPYQLFFPVSIYVGKTSGAALYQGLAMQIFWVLASYGLARLVWYRGNRKYSAVGG